MSNDYYEPRGFGIFPPIVKNLLIVNGVVFFIMFLFGNIAFSGYPADALLYSLFALQPIGNDFAPWQLITYQFMHAGLSHIFFNMFGLWMFGSEIESLWGSKKFLIYYLTCGVAAGVLHLVMTPVLGLIPAPTVGASGAVFGIMIAFAFLFPDRYVYIYFLIPVKTKYLVGFLILIEVFFVNSANSQVAHLAHIGGALAGFLFIMLDKSIYIPLKDSFRGSSFKRPTENKGFGGWGSRNKEGSPFQKRTDFAKKETIEDAKFYEIKENEPINQEVIDMILDKISRSGYAGLTEHEKKILFEASKRMNK